MRKNNSIKTFRLIPERIECLSCGGKLRLDYTNRRTVVTLAGTMTMLVSIARCHRRGCRLELKPYHPESEGLFALPKRAFGLDVVLAVGSEYERRRRLLGRRCWSARQIQADLRHVKTLISLRTTYNAIQDFDALSKCRFDEEARKVVKRQGCISLTYHAVYHRAWPSDRIAGLHLIEDTISQRVLVSEFCEECSVGRHDMHFSELYSVIESKSPVRLPAYTFTNASFDGKGLSP